MALSNKKMAKILKVAAAQIEAVKKQASDADALVQSLQEKIATSEKMARARAIATKLVVGDDVRREIDAKTLKMASEDMDVVEKALELGKQDAVLKLGEAIIASQNNGNKGDHNALIDCLLSL